MAARRIHPTFNISKVRRYTGPVPPVVLPPVPVPSTHPGRFEIEDILDHQGRGQNALYKVKWKYREACDSYWEPLEHFAGGGMESIRAYHKRKGLRPPPVPKLTSSTTAPAAKKQPTKRRRRS